MTKSVPRTARFLLTITIMLGAGACSASTEVESPTTTAAEPAATAVVVAPTPTPVIVAPAPTVAEASAEGDADSTAAPADVAEPTSNGTVEIAFEDGRTWSLNTIDCYTAPDAPFGIFFMSGINDAGADFGAVESWPLDGDKTGGTAFIATFWDETGQLYGVEGGPVTDNGGELSFTSNIYEGLALEPLTTGTFTCTP